MRAISRADIRARLDALAGPPAGLGSLDALAVRLCEVQNTLTPTVRPRRLVLFAADHEPGEASILEPLIREMVTGRSATAVLAKATHTDWLVVDVGSQCDPLRETAHYRCRRTPAKTHRLTENTFREAYQIGRDEAERAAQERLKLVAVDGLGNDAVTVAQRVHEWFESHQDSSDGLIDRFAEHCTADLAAAAGFIACAVTQGLTVLICGAFAKSALRVADRLQPGTAANVLMAPVPTQNDSASDGLAALLTVQHLEAAALILTHTAQRPHGREQIVPLKRRKVAIFTGSFDPPTTFHRRVVQALRVRGFDEVIIRPAGPRPDHPEVEHAAPIHRAVMADLAFRDIPGVTVDLADLDDGVFTPPVAFDDLLAHHGEVWHVVSHEFIDSGRTGASTIHTKWECGPDMWNTSRFVVLHPTERIPPTEDLPNTYQLLAVDGHIPTSDIRLRVFQGGRAYPDVPEAVEAYIQRYGLFSGKPSPRETRVRLQNPRLQIVFDERNDTARRLAERFHAYQSSDPTHILVLGGDGTMLHAIRTHWRLRLPFIGLNAGTLGFLMNEQLPDELDGVELVLYRMPMLRVDSELPDGKSLRSLACADAWVERDSGQAAWLRLSVDGRERVPRIVGDGLLVATPSGSSAYARAMGATPVPLTAPVLTLAGSNVFLPRFWRPVTLPESAVVTISSLDHNGKRPIRGFVDGHPNGPVRSMEVRVSSIAAIELGFTPQFDLSSRLLQSMFPPVENEGART
jgi:NAD kinase/nicotinic acid mononucleotide adenylyltransferase/NaMN:DMB phosphoribosyltransferase